MLYKLERMEESLDIFRLIADCARDKDEAPAPRGEGVPQQVRSRRRARACTDAHRQICRADRQTDRQDKTRQTAR